ncbi:peptidoglycan DD-metalloendopeptidase family protein [Candidatus Berkelbacteria bacterium]|nr:peptidoglycan DD-metalloendopeptidase family protein [Candidatus Berkelbacteria bacterium]
MDDWRRTRRGSLLVLSGLVSAGLVAFLVVPAVSLGAEDKSQDRTRLNDLAQQAQDLNAQIQAGKKAVLQKQKEATSLTNQIDRIETDISTTEDRITKTGSDINSVESQIRAKEAAIAVKEQELNTQTDNQAEALRVLYETTETELLFMVAGSDSISEYVDHQEYLEALEDQIASTIAEIERLKRELEQERSELGAKQQELTKLKAQQEAYKAGLDNERNRKDQLLTRTKEEQVAFEAQVDQAKRLNAQVESEMSAIRARLTKNSQGPGVIQAKDRGTSAVGFQWPTDYRYVSTYFGGATPFQPNGGHGGLDLVNAEGTPIYAAGDGTVTAVQEMTYNGRYYAYGRYIVVGHNARWSSLYGHLSAFAVAPGDEVKRGDVIGYMGSTGWSTGPHLHFEIWDSASRVNPLSYLP